MRIKGLISSFLIFALVLVGNVFPSMAAVEGDTIQYLKSQDKSNAWVVMALRSAGQSVSANKIKVDSLNSATDIERTILAVVAGNDNPYAFKSKDLVALLDGKRTNKQIGSQLQINDDIWGILAYISAGVDNSDLRVKESRDFLLDNQNSDGGWSHATTTPSDSNDTALAINALVKAGVSANDPVINKAIDYLKTVQNADAGFAISAGLDSDSASTSWVISALQAAGRTPASWAKGTQTPFTFLNKLKVSDGSYKWKESDGQSGPVMTSYVTIALQGNSYPVAFYANGTGNPPINPGGPGSVKVSYRIEGSQQQVCSGEISVKDPLDLIRKASNQCNFTYFIEDTSFGPYLKSINSDIASGTSGWLYLVNWEQASVGAQDYDLKKGDYVTWYFGEFDWTPLRSTITNLTQAQVNGNPNVLVEEFSDGFFKPLQGASVWLGGQVKTTNNLGLAGFVVGSGTHSFYADKNGHVRSAIETFVINDQLQISIPLQTNVVIPVPPPPPPPPPASITISKPKISFDVNVQSSTQNKISFGDINPGEKKSHVVVLRNTGDVKLDFTATVTGHSLFVSLLKLNNQLWNLYSQTLHKNQDVNVGVSLEVPADYTDAGQKNGELIFWAQP